MLHCIRTVDLLKENISQEKAGENSNANQRTIGRMESSECMTWHTMLNVYYYYCQFEGIEERYDTYFQKLYNMKDIPDKVIMQLEDKNYDKSKIKEEYVKTYQDAVEVCKIDFFHLASERKKIQEENNE